MSKKTVKFGLLEENDKPTNYSSMDTNYDLAKINIDGKKTVRKHQTGKVKDAIHKNVTPVGNDTESDESHHKEEKKSDTVSILKNSNSRELKDVIQSPSNDLNKGQASDEENNRVAEEVNALSSSEDEDVFEAEAPVPSSSTSKLPDVVNQSHNGQCHYDTEDSQAEDSRNQSVGHEDVEDIHSYPQHHSGEGYVPEENELLDSESDGDLVIPLDNSSDVDSDQEDKKADHTAQPRVEGQSEKDDGKPNGNSSNEQAENDTPIKDSRSNLSADGRGERRMMVSLSSLDKLGIVAEEEDSKCVKITKTACACAAYFGVVGF